MCVFIITQQEVIMIRFGFDLGANHIRLISKEDGLVFDEPCMVALDRKNRVIAIGNEAKDMKGMDESIRVISPLGQKEIDFDALNLLMEQLCYQFNVFRVFQKTELIVSYPTSFTDEQCEDLKQNLLEFGAYRVYMDQEIWMAAIGANLDLFLPVSSCILNIGYSNCDIALFSSGKMQKKSNSSISGKSINYLIGKWVRQEYGLIISEHMKEKINKGIATALMDSYPKQMHVQGMDVHYHQIKVITINSNKLVNLIQSIIQQWANWIEQFVNGCTPVQKEDIISRGIICCGGVMKLPGIAQTLRQRLPYPFYITDDPEQTVSQGIYILLSRME